MKANASLNSLAPRFAVEAHVTTLVDPQAPDDAPPTEAALSMVGLDIRPEVPSDLVEHDASRHAWIDEAGRPDRSIKRGRYQRRSDFEASRTDPDAALMAHKRGGLHTGYDEHVVIDGGTARIILVARITPSDVMEHQPALDLLWRACFRWCLTPQQVTTDTTHATGENIRAIKAAGMHAYMPLADWDRTAFYGPSRFTYDAERDVYRCPEEHALDWYSCCSSDASVAYRGAAAICNACPVNAACTTSNSGRMIHRSIYTEDFERVRAYHDTPAYRTAMRKRSVWIEPLFAEAKDWHGLRRFRLRRLANVNIEALLVASEQNLKRWLAATGWGRRWGPAGALSAPTSRHVGRRLAALGRS